MILGAAMDALNPFGEGGEKEDKSVEGSTVELNAKWSEVTNLGMF